MQVNLRLPRHAIMFPWANGSPPKRKGEKRRRGRTIGTQLSLVSLLPGHHPRHVGPFSQPLFLPSSRMSMAFDLCLQAQLPGGINAQVYLDCSFISHNHPAFTSPTCILQAPDVGAHSPKRRKNKKTYITKMKNILSPDPSLSPPLLIDYLPSHNARLIYFDGPTFS